ncbi:2-dehydro-3-deoxy-6-phosphogalactonate aldolase [Leeia sp.]|uniref:2-dehydro-3-deoxy-6-phosphogalactonate aldolase n=1 Tax=Leeia sp. TaxID=2884678 RepID=UPI0035AE27E9
MIPDLQKTLPLIAILRGLPPEAAREVGLHLYEAGFRLIEVPLNRPGALEAIVQLTRSLPEDAWIGAGTVLSAEAVAQVADAGGKMVISPDSNPAVIAAARARKLWSLPGVATPTEAFAALRSGAHGLKAFPAEAIPPAVLKAWRAVIPPDIPIFPVGGITPGNMAAYITAGASGFGLGGGLYTPGISIEALKARATAYVQAWQQA